MIATIQSRFLELEKLSWMLSTYGGALSQMGDYFDSFVSPLYLFRMLFGMM